MFDCVSKSSSSKAEVNSKNQNSSGGNYQGLVPEFNFSKYFLRKRGVSHDDEVIGAKSKALLVSFMPEEHWKDIKHENEEERIAKFIDFLNNDVNKQTQLLDDFQEYYFDQKPLLKVDTLKRLFFG